MDACLRRWQWSRIRWADVTASHADVKVLHDVIEMFLTDVPHLPRRLRTCNWYCAGPIPVASKLVEARLPFNNFAYRSCFSFAS
jgi:hypothetical protein